MSTIPTKQIDGDVAVGRNVQAGGDAVVQGNVRVGHNLRVEGWLDARNIKGPNRGLFPTVEALKSQCPLPHAGWYALVGDTLPATVYMGVDGEWVTMGKQGGNPTLDSSKYDADIEELEGDVSAIKGKIAEHTAYVEGKLQVFGNELTDVRKGMVNEIGISEGAPRRLLLYRQGLTPLSVELPQASESSDGLMTKEHVAALTKAVADVLVAQSTAESMAVTELKFFNMEDGHYGAIGLSQGGKGAASVMIPHSTTERSGLMCRGQAIHLDELYKDMPGVKSSLTQAHSKADDALAAADGAQASADAAQSAANNALTQARAAVAKGLQLPRFSGTVIDGVPRGSSVLNQGAGFRSTSPGCAVVFDKSCDRFLLRVYEQGALFPTFYTLWADAEQMGLTEDSAPELPRIFKASPGVAYMATEPPYGLWLLGVGQADLIEGTQPPAAPDLSAYAKARVMTEAEYEALGEDVSDDVFYFLTEDDQA